MAQEQADAIIIGAGAAGLAAADELCAAGKRIILIEGRDRLGGRLHTVHDPAWPVPIERGAEFVHGKPPETWDIIHAGLCCLYDVTDEHFIFERGKLIKKEGFFEEIEKVMGLIEKIGRDDLSYDETVARYSARMKPEAKRYARQFVEGFNAADAREVSTAWLKRAQEDSDEIEGEKLFRLAGGYEGVTEFLRTGISNAKGEILLGTLVQRVNWERGEAAVVVRNMAGEMRTFRAPRVLVTVPLGVLQAAPGAHGHIEFVPGLPEKKREAIGQLRMGAVMKLVLRFRETFWEEKYPDLNFFHWPGAAIPTWWTMLPMRGAVLTGWAGGPAGAALSGRSTETILEVAMGQLAKMFGMARRKVEGLFAEGHVCDWQSDPLSRGAYSYAAVGGAKAADELAKPVAGTLFFAGEATHGGMSGTVAGAISSGKRAAKEMLRGR